MMERDRYGEGKEQLMIWIMPQYLPNMVELKHYTGMYSLQQNQATSTDDQIADRSSRMNCEEYRAMLCVHIQPNAARLIRQSSAVQMDNGPKHTAGATQAFLKTKEMRCPSMVKSVT